MFSIDVTRDYSQVVTRVLSEGGGGNAVTQIPAGTTVLPVDTGVWYEAAGEVVTGNQRLTYTGVQQAMAAADRSIGPGAAPTASPGLALASGSGVPTGPHDYGITFVTASGESLIGPRGTIAVGFLGAPDTAPENNNPQAGSGPEVGVHLYAFTYVTASGETLPSPTLSVTVNPLPASHLRAESRRADHRRQHRGGQLRLRACRTRPGPARRRSGRSAGR